MSNKDAPNLPGYYFDAKTNRYYKLISGQEHINPVTGGSFEKKPTNVKLEKPTGDVHKRRLTSKNLHSLLSHREVSSPKFLNGNRKLILNNLIGKIFKKSDFSELAPEHDIEPRLCRLLLSENEERLLLQTERMCIVYRRPFTSRSTTFHTGFTLDNRTALADISFASVSDAQVSVLAAFSQGANSYLKLFISDCRFQPQLRRTGYVNTCKWHKSYFAYSLNNKLVIVNDWQRHLANTSYANVGADVLQPKNHPTSSITTLECTDFIVYVGFVNSKIFGYDKRACQKTAIKIHSGETGKNVCCIKALKSGSYLITRHGNTVDSTYLWDLRHTTKPLLQYGAFENSHNVGFRGMQKSFFVNSAENILSCYHIDNTLRLWDIQTGVALAQTTELEGGLFSENLGIFENKPGLLGIRSKKLVFLPL